MDEKHRIVMLCDMQSFYASVEKAANPHIRDKPIAVAGDPERRSGIILAACPLAKKYGVTTAETLNEALIKCPELILVKPRMQHYIDVSIQISEIMQRYSDLVESFSIDELFIEVTHTQHIFGDPLDIARMIQTDIQVETGVRARVGISFNKVVAKIACDNFAKKNASGIFWLHKENIEKDMWPLQVEDMFGVGSRMKQHLNNLGIRTIGQLAKTSVDRLKKRWGVNGIVLWRTANAIDPSPVDPSTHNSQKVIGHQITLPRDYHEKAQIDVILLELASDVCRRTRHKGYVGTVVSVGCSGADFNTPQGFYRQKKIDEPTSITDEVYSVAKDLFRTHWTGYPVRRIGLSLSGLFKDDTYQLSLFNDRDKYLKLENTIDLIKDRFGSSAILRAASLTSSGQARMRSIKIGGHYK